MKLSKWSKRSLLFILSAMMACAAAGCDSGTGGSSTASTSSSPSSSAASASEDGDAVKTLSIAIPQNPNVEDFDTNMLTTWLEEDMNVNLEFTLLPATSEDANTKVSLWVSSNSDLPDVLCMSLSDTVAQDYASKGVLVDVTDYYADPEISVNISSSRFDGERDIIMNSIRFADGKYYSLFSYGQYILGKPANGLGNRAIYQPAAS